MAVILVPCKNLDHGKSRLSGHLSPSARRELCVLFLRRTLGLATSLVASRQVILVTADPGAIEISREYGTSALVERRTGLNSALSDARDVLLGEGTVGPDVLVLPIDLPLASANALSRVMDAEADVVLVPDEEWIGTNLLLVKSRALPLFPFSYGDDSYRAHHRAAREAGLSFESVDDGRLAFDVDRPGQFVRWQAIHGQQACLMKETTPRLDLA